MAQDSQYESTVFISSYPSGKTPWNLIDDKMRAILAAIRARQNDEHYWRYANENIPDGEVPYAENTGEDGAAEGRHRPESARAWQVVVGEVNDIPSFPDARDYHEGALFVVDGDPDTAPDDTSAQWKGTAWFIKNRILLPLISRFRGKIRFDGKMIFGPEVRKWQGKLLPSGFTINELHQDRASDLPTTASDNITLYPFHVYAARQHGVPATDERNACTLYPIRVGQFDQATDIFTESDASTKRLPERTPSYGVAFDIGKFDPSGLGRGTRIILTERGIEIFTTNQAEDHRVTFNGVDVLNHDHTGSTVMGKQLTPSAFVSTNDDDEENSIQFIWSNVYTTSLGILTYTSGGGFLPLTLAGITPEHCQPTFADDQNPVALKLQRSISVNASLYLVEGGEDRDGGTVFLQVLSDTAENNVLGTAVFKVANTNNVIAEQACTIHVPSISQAGGLELASWAANSKIRMRWMFMRHDGTHGTDDRIGFSTLRLQFMAWRV